MELRPNDFPEEFKIQRIRLAAANALVDLPPAEIAAHFRAHPKMAMDLISESYDKRWTPASFITEDNEMYTVGWFSAKLEYKCIRRFINLADAATDYLLFSLGKGRWTDTHGKLRG